MDNLFKDVVKLKHPVLAISIVELWIGQEHEKFIDSASSSHDSALNEM